MDELLVQDATMLYMHMMIWCSSQVGYAPHATHTHTYHPETRDKAASCSALLTKCWAYLLQQHSVVSLKGLEDVMIAAQGSKPVHGGIAMPSTTLTADGQRLRCVLGGIRLQACTASVYFAWLSSLTATLARSDTVLLYMSRWHAAPDVYRSGQLPLLCCVFCLAARLDQMCPSNMVSHMPCPLTQAQS